MPQKIPVVHLSGIVTPYEGNGRGFGYPTANIGARTVLAEGVYFGFADLAGYMHHPALIFVGTPVTIGATRHRVEAHLFDIIDTDYYGQHLQLKIQHFHRANEYFASVPELLAAMKDDELTARVWFKTIPSAPSLQKAVIN